jgi:hypothetical protein
MHHLVLGFEPQGGDDTLRRMSWRGATGSVVV